MRAFWTNLAGVACVISGGAHAQSGGSSLGDPALATILPPRPAIAAYDTPMGKTVAESCDSRLSFASTPLLHIRIDQAKAKGETIDPKIEMLAFMYKTLRKNAPYQEMAIVGRDSIVRARTACGSDSRLAALTPEKLRIYLKLFAKETSTRASACQQMLNFTTKALLDERAEIIAKKNLGPNDIADALTNAIAAREVADDLQALCPEMDHIGLRKAGDAIDAGMAPLLPKLFDSPEFAERIGHVREQAALLATSFATAKPTADQIAFRCGALLQSYHLLLSITGPALAVYERERATPADKAAFALWASCWKETDGIRKAAAAYRATATL